MDLITQINNNSIINDLEFKISGYVQNKWNHPLSGGYTVGQRVQEVYQFTTPAQFSEFIVDKSHKRDGNLTIELIRAVLPEYEFTLTRAGSGNDIVHITYSAHKPTPNAVRKMTIVHDVQTERYILISHQSMF